MRFVGANYFSLIREINGGESFNMVCKVSQPFLLNMCTS